MRSDPIEESTTASEVQRWGVVLIHGVGDSRPSDMLDAVSRVMCAVNPELELEANHEFREEQEEKLDPSADASVFPILMRRGRSRRGRSGPDSVLFAETYWADLTRVGVDTPNVLFALVGFIYGLRHVALQASERCAPHAGGIPGRLGEASGAILRLALSFLLGPIFALLTLEISLISIYLFYFRPSWDQPRSPCRPLLLAALAAVASAAVILGAWASRSSKSVYWRSLIGVGVVLLVHVLLRATGAGGEVYAWFQRTGSKPLGEWLLVVAISDQLLLPSLWIISVLMCLNMLMFLLSLRFKDSPMSRSLRTALLSSSLLVGIFLVMGKLNDVLADHAGFVAGRHPAGYKIWYDDICLTILVVTLLVSALALLPLHARWSAAYSGGRTASARDGPPRLIIGYPIRILIFLFSVIFFPLALVDGLLAHLDLKWRIDYLWVKLPYTIGLALLLIWSLNVRKILHILRDITSHFADPGVEHFVARGADRRPEYPVRRRIKRRLRRVLDVVLEEDPTHLVVIAHSLGSVIALEELRDERWGPLLGSARSVTLLTFGSPFTHLFQEYLPLLYGDPARGEWQPLKGHVRRWINLYRVDDYIGTEIRSSESDWPTNIAFPPWRLPTRKTPGLQGHTRYWEADVFERLHRWLPFHRVGSEAVVAPPRQDPESGSE